MRYNMSSRAGSSPCYEWQAIGRVRAQGPISGLTCRTLQHRGLSRGGALVTRGQPHSAEPLWPTISMCLVCKGLGRGRLAARVMHSEQSGDALGLSGPPYTPEIGNPSYATGAS